MLGTGRGRIVSVLAIVSLALGIAGNAVAFSLVEAFLIRPLPYPEADRLVLLGCSGATRYSACSGRNSVPRAAATR
jgi:hypothetical protein